MAKKAFDSVQVAIQYLQRFSQEQFLFVKFTKKDGSLRLMKATLNFDLIPKDLRPKGVSLKDILRRIKDKKLISVFDLEKASWRSIPLDRIIWVRTKEQVEKEGIE